MSIEFSSIASTPFPFSESATLDRIVSPHHLPLDLFLDACPFSFGGRNIVTHVYNNTVYKNNNSSQDTPIRASPSSYSGLTIVANKRVRFCGGKPSSYVADEHGTTALLQPSSYLQFRTFETGKYQELLVKGITPVLASTSFQESTAEVAIFENWARDLKRVVVDRGLDTMLYVTQDTQELLILDNFALFSVAALRQHEQQFRKDEGDKSLQSMNEYFLLQLIKNSVTSDFYTDISLLANDNDGPLVILGLLYAAHRGGGGNLSVHLHALNKVPRLSDIPGLDVSVLATKLLVHLRPLLSANGQELTTYEKVMDLFEGSTVRTFADVVASYQSKVLSSLDTRSLAKTDLLTDVVALVSVYNKLKNKDKWEVADSAPSTALVATESTIADASPLGTFLSLPNGQFAKICEPPSASGDNVAPSSSSGSSGSEGKRSKNNSAWRFKKSYGAKCSFNNKTYNWCEKCHRGKGMYQFTHSTATHVGKPVPVSVEPSPASDTTTDDTSTNILAPSVTRKFIPF